MEKVISLENIAVKVFCMRIIKKNIIINDSALESIKNFKIALLQLDAKIIQSSENKIEAHLKYGFQNTKLKIIANEFENDNCNIELIGWSDDIWGKGAKSSIKRTLDFYGNQDKIASFKDKNGFNVVLLATLGYLFMLGIRQILRNQTVFDLIIYETDLVMYSSITLLIIIFGYRYYTIRQFNQH